MLLCPVRDCRQPLERDTRQLRCLNRHSFDIARSGYINLLQPQDKKSKHPGDTPAAVAARRRLHDRGLTAPLLAAIEQLLEPSPADSILDAGCGEGYYLGSLAARTPFQAHGLDISIPAIDAAARRYPACQWIVANADRFIPYAPQSFSAVVSITARMNTSEFRRVLQNHGRLLVAIPAPDDLIELRGQGRDRLPRTLETFAPAFTPIHQSRVTTTADLDAATIDDVLHSIYRPLHPDPIAPKTLTLSLDLLLFRPK